MGIQLSDWVENIVGKGEIARYEQFVLFTRCFQKLCDVDAAKWVSMEYRVNNLEASLDLSHWSVLDHNWNTVDTA